MSGWSTGHVMKEFQESESPPFMLLPTHYIHIWDPGSRDLWKTLAVCVHYIRIPRACIQTNVCGNKMKLVAHLEEIEPRKPEPQCKKPALGQDQVGGRTGLSVLSGLFPTRNPVYQSRVPDTCPFAPAPMPANESPASSVLYEETMIKDPSETTGFKPVLLSPP